jgi:DNA (cytosine-5)-methyltransferase 1
MAMKKYVTAGTPSSVQHMARCGKPGGSAPARSADQRPGSGLRVADLFAGIGGFHLAFHRIGARVVFAAENNPAARRTYEANFTSVSPELFSSSQFPTDIRDVGPASMPDFDVLCAGFPCQPFSEAGCRRGFDDPRGTLFFEVARILQAKRPAAFFLENVRGLLTHDAGRTMQVISRTLTRRLGYSLHTRVVRACDFGLAQLRPRVFMVGFADAATPFAFPEPIPLTSSMDDVFGGHCDRQVGYTVLASGGGKAHGTTRAWDAYLVDGQLRRVGPAEALRMQGFAADFQLPASAREAMKQLGNSVAVPAVQATAAAIAASLAQHAASSMATAADSGGSR